MPAFAGMTALLLIQSFPKDSVISEHQAHRGDAEARRKGNGETADEHGGSGIFNLRKSA